MWIWWKSEEKTNFENGNTFLGEDMHLFEGLMPDEQVLGAYWQLDKAILSVKYT